MKGKQTLVAVVSICLILVLVAVILPGCTKSAPAPTSASNSTSTPASTSAQAAQQVWNLKAQCINTSNDPVYITYTKMADQLKQLSGGRINLHVYAEGDLVPDTGILDAVGSGAVDVGFTFFQMHLTLFPEAYMDVLPMLVRDDQDAWVVYSNPQVINDMNEAVKPYGVHYIGTVYPADCAFFYNKPINTFADWKNTKIRTFGVYIELYKQAGATIVSFPPGDIFTGLQTGLVDGIFTTVPIYESQKCYEVAKYFYNQPRFPTANDVIINQKVWDSLPDDLKTVVNYVTGPILRDDMKYVYEQSNHVVASLAGWGAQNLTLSSDIINSLTSMAVPLLQQKEANSARGQEILNIAMENARNRGYIK